jgi:hypothetical protein
MPDHASQLYAKNVQSLLALMVDDEGALGLDFEDEIISGACITSDGEIVHEGARKAAGMEEKPSADDGPKPEEHGAEEPEAEEAAKPGGGGDS